MGFGMQPLGELIAIHALVLVDCLLFLEGFCCSPRCQSTSRYGVLGTEVGLMRTHSRIDQRHAGRPLKTSAAAANIFRRVLFVGGDGKRLGTGQHGGETISAHHTNDEPSINITAA